MRALRLTRPAHVALVTFALAAAPDAATAQSSAPKQPWSLPQVLELVQRGVKSTRVLKLVNQDCIAFEVDSASEEQLRSAGADTALVGGLRSVCNTAAARADSIARADCIARADSLARADSALQADSASRADSLARADSIARADSMARADSAARADSVARVAAKARADSIAQAAAKAQAAAVERAAAARRDSIEREKRIKTMREARLRALADSAAKCQRACIPLRYRYAQALEGAGQLFQALDEYRAAIRTRPAKSRVPEKAYKAPIHNAAGRVLLKGDAFGEAIRHFEEAVDGQKVVAAYRYNLGVALECQGQVKKAASAYKEAVAINPLTPGAWEALKRTRAGRATCRATSAIVEQFR